LRSPLVLLVALFAMGCASGGDTADIDCDRDPPLTYDSWGEGFVSKHCTGCHGSLVTGDQRNGATVGVDLDTYGNVMVFAERFEARVLDPDWPEMPPGGGPTEEELQMLREWLTCGVYPDRESLEE
jgi:hypothetical protein